MVNINQTALFLVDGSQPFSSHLKIFLPLNVDLLRTINCFLFGSLHQNFSFPSLAIVKILLSLLSLLSGIYRQSQVKNQPINHKVENFHVLTKVPHNTSNKSKSSQFIPKETYTTNGVRTVYLSITL